MKSYDDLQRFKEKTQHNHIAFKDMSEQSRADSATNWAIIKQLMQAPSDNALEGLQSVSQSVPEAVDPHAFTAPPATPAPVAILPDAPVRAAAPSAAPGGGLLNALAAALPDKPAAVAPTSPAVTTESKGAASLLASMPPPAAPAPAPVATAPVSPAAFSAPPASAPAPASEGRFRQLFSAQAASVSSAQAESKQTLLQPLLEKIASCR
ncbi:cellulose biosynthesis protein BcsO [Enterobacterales bacterium CwR94]|nr:cellulose biosynthesis protein BcsO [Enterobacterales bacterium CwR94]